MTEAAENKTEKTAHSESRHFFRGEIYYADLGVGEGSEQCGYRPVVIIQNDIGNRYSPTLIVASISSKIDSKPKMSTHCYIDREGGLSYPSVVLLEQIRTVDKKRIGPYIGHLSARSMEKIDNALSVSVDLVPRSGNSIVMSLCSTCAANFRRANAYALRRLYEKQNESSVCAYCGKRLGFYYEISMLIGGGR